MHWCFPSGAPGGSSREGLSTAIEELMIGDWARCLPCSPPSDAAVCAAKECVGPPVRVADHGSRPKGRRDCHPPPFRKRCSRTGLAGETACCNERQRYHLFHLNITPFTHLFRRLIALDSPPLQFSNESETSKKKFFFVGGAAKLQN